MTTFEDQIDALLGELSTATSEEIETALGKYDTRDLLTVVAKRALAAGSGGSAPVTILGRTVSMTDADIKDAAASLTGFELVPAQGAGVAVNVLRIICSSHIVGAYTSIGAGSYLNVQVGLLDMSIQAFNSGTYFGNQFVTVLLQASGIVTLGPGYDVGNRDLAAQPPQAFIPSDLSNKPISLQLLNNGGELGGGDPANTLSITTIYSLFNVSA